MNKQNERQISPEDFTPDTDNKGEYEADAESISAQSQQQITDLKQGLEAMLIILQGQMGSAQNIEEVKRCLDRMAKLAEEYKKRIADLEAPLILSPGWQSEPAKLTTPDQVTHVLKTADDLEALLPPRAEDEITDPGRPKRTKSPPRSGDDLGGDLMAA